MKPGTFTQNFFSALFVLGVFAFTFNVERNQQDQMKSVNKMLESMNNIASTQNFDRDFSEMMAEHHQAAIDMTEQVLKNAKDEKLIALAKKMQEDLEQEIKQLREFVYDNKASSDSKGKNKDVLMSPVRKAIDELMKMKMTGEIQRDFAVMMIVHHKSGIEMANLQISRAGNKKLKELSKKMVEGLNNEIKNLQDWLDNKSVEN